MPKLHLTDTVVNKLEYPPDGQILFWDDELPGFGVRVTASSKVFIAQGKVETKDRRVKVGRCNDLTTQEARKLAKKKLGEMASDIDHNAEKAAQRSNNITLQQVFDDYLQSKTLRKKTVELYTDAMVRFFPDWKEKKLTDIDREMVRKKFSSIVQSVAAASEKRRTGSSVSSQRGKAQASLVMRLLSSLFEYAQQKYEDANKRAIVKENPVKGLSLENKGWRTVPRRQTVILPGELSKFYKGICAVKGETSRDYLLFLLLSGLRRREASALTWDEVDLDHKSITLPGERTKNHKPHGLPLSDYLQNMLERRKQKATASYVFPSRIDGRSFDDPKRAIDTVKKHLGKSFSCHDLRRTFITVADSLDISEHALKTLVNHSSSDVTSGYVISNIERLRAPMQRITDYIIEQMEVTS